MNRYLITCLAAVLAVLAILAPASLGLAAAAALERQELASGGIGLTRDGWEAEHGPGELVDPTAPLFGELYAYEDARYHVAFEGSKSEADDVVMYVEVAWGEEGVRFEDARVTVQKLLPVDAEVTEAYFAPPTPGGPVALNTFRYASPSLDTVPYGTDTLTPNVLVTYHERIETISTGHQVVHEEHVMRVSIMAQIPPG